MGAAFHSPLVAPAANAFRAGLESVAFQVPTLPVISNSTATPWPQNADAAKDLLGQQLALPVRFNEVVERLFADGARTFVEVGPRSALTGMVRATLGSKPHHAIAVDANSSRGGLFDLANALARVAAVGHHVALERWQAMPAAPRANPNGPRVPKMQVPLTGANYRAPFTPLPRVERKPTARTAQPLAVTTQPSSDALRANQEHLRALQAMQEQTARLHQKFLEGQLATQQAFQAMLQGAPTATVIRPPVVPTHPPKPTAVTPIAATPVAALPAKPVTVDARQTVLDVVADATGYPVETLSLSMDLEADLGIDSIKRVEILSLLSKRMPGAPSVNPEKLSSLKTLQHVLDFVGGGQSASAPAEAPVAPAPSAPAPAKAGARLVSRRIVVPTRLAVGTPVALPAGEWLVTGDDGLFASALVSALKQAGHSARVWSLNTAAATSADPSLKVAGVVLISPTGPWSGQTERMVKNALFGTRAMAKKLREQRGLLVAISRRDGAFGHTAPIATDRALHGALAGLVKTASHEWPEVRCRAIDVSSAWADADAATEIARELALDGPLEVGLGPAGRVTLSMKPQTAHARHSGQLERGDVVVVTGGARGVTAECARALAQRHQATLLLLGRTLEPTTEAPWLEQAHDEATIKRLLLEHAPAGPKPTPKQLGDACRGVLAAREIRSSLRALQAAGVRAEYRSVDVRDSGRLAEVLTEARRTLGPIRGVIHGAGVLRDKRIEDKRDDDVDQVVDTKLTGLRALLEATAHDDLRVLALFASVTGRFGRRGQADYALANQALVSVAQVEAARRPFCRVVALDWGPWEAGMVTPALKAEFEREGVALIPLAEGAEVFCEEMNTAPASAVEVVVGAGFGEAVGSGAAVSAWSLAATHHLDPAWPILRDHRLSGRPVLPLALSLEWLAQAAAKHQPDTTAEALATLDDVRVLKGVTVGLSGEDVFVWVGPLEPTPMGPLARIELRNARDQVHVRATARWPATQASKAVPTARLEGLPAWPHTVRQAYTTQLFHGPALEVIEAIDGLGPEGMRVRLKAPPPTDLVPTATHGWVTNPAVIDGVFQALIVWCRSQRGAPSLPSRLGAWKQFAPFGGHVNASIFVRDADAGSVTCDVDLADDTGQLVGRLEGYVCTVSATLEQAFAPEPTAVTPLTTSA